MPRRPRVFVERGIYHAQGGGEKRSLGDCLSCCRFWLCWLRDVANVGFSEDEPDWLVWAGVSIRMPR